MSPPPRRTQADRRAHTRAALLDAAARGLSRDGYRGLNLAAVAAEAGYTRGALYHLFANKEALALAVVGRVRETWEDEVAIAAQEVREPLDALVALARGHVVWCRDGRARVMMTLRVEFAEREHPVGRAVWSLADDLRDRVERLLARARRAGRLPPGPPARVLAAACLAGLEGLAIGVAGRTPHDADLAERLVLGVLGAQSAAGATSASRAAASPRTSGRRR